MVAWGMMLLVGLAGYYAVVTVMGQAAAKMLAVQ
jgi:hypothetical protein